MKTDPRISTLNGRLVQSHKTLQIKTQTILSKINQATREIAHRLDRQVLQPLLHFADAVTDAHQWQQAAVVIRSHRKQIRQFEERSIRPYVGLLVIALFVFVGNQANQRALAADDYPEALVLDVEPEVLHAVLATIDPLTPEMPEEPAVVASMYISDDEGYLSRPDLAAMTEAEKLSKKDPIPYTVKQGDTMVSIARDNGRTVATILEANNIKPEDAGRISPGVTLQIPQEDTSTSLAWLEAENAAKAEAARKRAQILAAAQKSSRNRAYASTTRERADGGYTGETVGGFIVPIRHNGISRGISRGHAGIDYRANTGTSVVASANGRVIEITHGWAGGFGISILVDHGGKTTRYAHLSDTAVGVGQQVSQGQTIGYSGNTGRSTGPHLHFETRSGGRVVSPF